MNRGSLLKRSIFLCSVAGIMGAITVSNALATANVLMLPDREAFKGQAIVVWGRTNLANGNTFTLDFGDGSPVFSGTLGAVGQPERTYIAAPHAYAAAGMFTAQLTVGVESETATITVLDPALLTTAQKRGIMINMAIEDAKRFIYFNQCNRTAVSNTQSWHCAFPDNAREMSYTSLAVLSVENHGHLVTNDPNKDIYQDTVQRGLNYIFDRLTGVILNDEPAGVVCGVGLPPADLNPCLGLAQVTFPSGYSTAIAGLAVAGSGAPARIVGAGLGVNNGFFVAGKTYAEILQRQINTLAWAQADSVAGGCFNNFNQGGLRYSLDDCQSDGSALGWFALAMLDGQAAGATLPGFVKIELPVVIGNTSCPQPAADLTDGLGYTACFGPGSGNVLRTGVALQALNFMGVAGGDSRVTNATGYIGAAWNALHPNNESFTCFEGAGGLLAGSPGGSINNKGCAYAMFQVFKGMKLYGINTFAGVNRPANVLVDPANPPNLMPRVGDINDWHKDYEDYLAANQQSPTATGGGNWGAPQLGWSCCETAASSSNNGVTALALLILSPTALVLPQNLVLAPATDTNPVGTSHTVTATATTAGGAPVPGATVTFTVIAGPDVGVNGTGTSPTDANGQASFTYTNNGTAGTDQIQASIGNLKSNIVEKIWKPEVTVGKCPLTQGYWKNHASAWPVTSLILGSQTYSQAELLTLLNTPVRGDASLNLAHQLIAVKLNMANGSDPAPINATKTASDALLSGFSGKLPYNVKTSSPTGQSMVSNAGTLDKYNNGQLTPDCTP